MGFGVWVCVTLMNERERKSKGIGVMRLEKLHVICTRGGCRVLRGLWGKIMGMGSPPKKIVLELNFDYLENSSRLI